MNNGIVRQKLTIKGIVQGVGFRPFVFQQACACALAGHVYNDASGVRIEVEGREESVREFSRRLQSQLPPRARIDEVITESLPPTGRSGFEILLSRSRDERTTLIPPDIAQCPDCLREMRTPTDRRCGYAFINCTNCGPRFTIIQGVPYDRPMTTMSGFTLCNDCRREYEDPHNRRFHAQPNACPDCGPSLWLAEAQCPDAFDKSSWPQNDKAVAEAARRLREGEVIAIKGMGGYHIACSALDDAAVDQLRRRKRRNRKPFAIMVASVEQAGLLCELSPAQQRQLQSYAAPVVLLKKRPDCPIAEQVAPGLDELGVMLPYTPVHHLLLDAAEIPLVMTSANFSEEPIAYRDQHDAEKLTGLADALLVHNRSIHMRCDDSVIRLWKDRPMILRRSRGYTPVPISLSVATPRPLLACGAMLKNTFCLARDDQYLLSHHIGDLENLETLESFEQGIRHFEQLFRCMPEAVVCDLHPDYLSTRYAGQMSRNGQEIPLLRLQHHRAHVISCLADNDRIEPVIGIAWDGLGYGDDGTIWGCEFFTGDPADLQRAGHLEPVAQPGGDAATREPWRMALSYLNHLYGSQWRKHAPGCIHEWPEEALPVVEAMLNQGINLPLTTSAGRLFDAAAALAAGARKISYEGEAAIHFEALARRSEFFDKGYPFRITWQDDKFIVSCADVFGQLLEDIENHTPAGNISMKFHQGLAEAITEACSGIRERTGLSLVALSGGVFQNILLLDLATSGLREKGFEVLTHSQVPPNDGGIALGQAAWAAMQLKK